MSISKTNETPWKIIMTLKLKLIISLIFGILALILWISRFFYEIDIIYPILCNIVQFVYIYKIKKT